MSSNIGALPTSRTTLNAALTDLLPVWTGSTTAQMAMSVVKSVCAATAITVIPAALASPQGAPVDISSSVQSAINSAATLGGIIRFEPCGVSNAYAMQDVQLASGVSIDGVMPQALAPHTAGQVDSEPDVVGTLNSGSILMGATPHSFLFRVNSNAIDPTVAADIDTDVSINGCFIHDLGVTLCAGFVKAGAQNRSGLGLGAIYNIVAYNCVQDTADHSTPVSITAVSWSASVATYTPSSMTGIYIGKSVTILSSNPVGYNGRYIVQSVTGSTFSVHMTTNPGSWVSGSTVTLGYDWLLSLKNCQHFRIYNIFASNIARGNHVTNDNPGGAWGSVFGENIHIEAIKTSDYKMKRHTRIENLTTTTVGGSTGAQSIDLCHFVRCQFNCYYAPPGYPLTATIADTIGFEAVGEAGFPAQAGTFENCLTDGYATKHIQLTNTYSWRILQGWGGLPVDTVPGASARCSSGIHINLTNAKRTQIFCNDRTTVINADSNSAPYTLNGTIKRFFNTSTALPQGGTVFIMDRNRTEQYASTTPGDAALVASVDQAGTGHLSLSRDNIRIPTQRGVGSISKGGIYTHTGAQSVTLPLITQSSTLVAVDLVSGGSGYTAGATATVGVAGSGGTLDVKVVNGVIIGIEVVTSYTGLTKDSTIVITPVGAGSGASANPVRIHDMQGMRIDVINTAPPTSAATAFVTVTPAGGDLVDNLAHKVTHVAPGESVSFIVDDLLRWVTTSRTVFSGVLPAAVTLGGSLSAYQNTTYNRQQILISGGTYTLVEFSRDKSTWYPLGTTGNVMLNPGDYMRVTYSVIPTVTSVQM